MEMLERYYCEREDPDEICASMRVTKEQFETLKRSAKAHFSRLGTSTWAPLPARVPFCMN